MLRLTSFGHLFVLAFCLTARAREGTMEQQSTCNQIQHRSHDSLQNNDTVLYDTSAKGIGKKVMRKRGQRSNTHVSLSINRGQQGKTQTSYEVYSNKSLLRSR
ncbi:hypothetical protein V8F33_009204 [Rhypophila sp. PSN 637]